MACPDILFREQSVVKAHEKTFQWIFEEEQQDLPWESFCQWLETPDKQLYWITGKAGSGKSTLMRYISQPPASGNSSNQPEGQENLPRCSPFLRRWAGSQPLLIASFYFWAVGSPMQRSKEGMLRTLLHELLKEAEPEMIATIAPESWEALCLFDKDPRLYSEDLLQKMLDRALQRLSKDNEICYKICIFIDGLDEFKGEHSDLVGFLRDAVRAFPIKLCISSRPWQVFEDAFQDTPSLKLEDLTLTDITAYIHSHLHPDPAFALLRTLEPSFADNLIDNIAAKADGVFLWVNLVVASLQKGIKAGDPVLDLQRRLDQLPQDLEGLFGRILDDLDPEYFDHAVQYFQLMEASLQVAPPNVMVFAFADEEDKSFGVDFPVGTMDKRIYETTRDVLKKRLNSRCMGLLEIAEQSAESKGVFVDASRSSVKYLHRTVRDYIARVDVQEKLSIRANRALHQTFDPDLRLCSAQLAFCKCSDVLIAPDAGHTPVFPDMSDNIVKATFRSLSACLHHASEVQDAGLPHMVRLLDTLEGVCSQFFTNYRCCNQHFVLVSPGRYRLARGLDRYERAYERREYAFTSLVIQHHVVEYMRAKVRQRPHRVAFLSTNVKTKIRPIFQKTILGREKGKYSDPNAGAALQLDGQLHDAVVTTLPCPATVQLLLERGADPQYTHKGRALKEPGSYWELALAAYIIVYRENPSQEYVWEQVVRQMVRHGAPVRRSVVHKALRIAQGVRSAGGEDWSEALCDAVETNLKLMKREV